jgi:hypothetical protein
VKERRVGAAKSPHIGGDLEEVDVSFVSFLCAKEKSDREIFFASKKEGRMKFSLHQRKEE